MSDYDALINRADDAGDLVPQEVEAEVFENVPQQSAVLQMARQLPTLSTSEDKIDVIDSLPTAFFLTSTTAAASEGASSKATELTWTNVTLKTTDIGCYAVIPQNLLDDARIPIWERTIPHLQGAVGSLIDAAILYGTNAPSDWPTSIYSYCNSNSRKVSVAATTDIYEAIMSNNGVLNLVEEDGLMVTGSLAHPSMRALLRGLRDDNGQPIMTADPASATRYALDGEPLMFSKNGSINKSTTYMVSGDWNQLVYAFRQGMTFKVLEESVISDPDTGLIVHNLAQEKKAALMLWLRFGWALPLPPTQMDSSPYPFAVLAP